MSTILNDADITELKITLYTNIPKQNDYERIILTYSTLFSEDLKELKGILMNQKPFFTYKVRYDESKLSILSYDSIVKTFFKKETFLKRFGYSTNYLLESEAESTNNEIKRANIDNNIMLMLKYLLPTRYPAVNNHFNSYDMFIGKSSMNAFFFNPFKSRKNICLKINGKVYTVKKVIWLNDVSNHPEYNPFLEKDPVGKRLPKGSSNELLAKYKPEDYLKLNDCFVSKCSQEMKEAIYVGINKYDKDSEIYVDIELFEEEIKQEDENNINCPYVGDYLGEELIRFRKYRSVVKRKGQIIKMPLFSKATLKSRKKELEVIEEKVSEEIKQKREKEDRYYNDLDYETVDNYERIFNPVFDKLSRGKYKNKIRDFDINKKNFYFFLQNNESILQKLNNLIITGNIDEIRKLLIKPYFNDSTSDTAVTVFSKIDKEISNLTKFRATVTSKTKEENKEIAFQYELLKEFIRELKVTYKTKGGARQNKTSKKTFKKRHTIRIRN